jgi:hypothetical protein
MNTITSIRQAMADVERALNRYLASDSADDHRFLIDERRRLHALSDHAMPALLRFAEILHELCGALADSAFAIDLIHDQRVVSALNSLVALEKEPK